MLFKGSFVTAASGKVGGVVASRNRSGQYIRSLAIPVNPNTENQLILRNAFRTLMPSWSGLTEEQQAAWSEYAINVPRTNRVGDSFLGTAQSWYVGLNALRIQAGRAALAAAPVVFDRGAFQITPTAFIEDAGELSINFDNGAVAPANAWNATGGDLLIYIAGPANPGRSFRNTPFQLNTVVQGGATPLTTTTLVGTFSNAQRYWVRLVGLSPDGRYTSGAEYSFIPEEA